MTTSHPHDSLALQQTAKAQEPRLGARRRRLVTIGIVALLAVAGGSWAVVTRAGSGAKPTPIASAVPAAKPLEFSASEVVKPLVAPMPMVIQFSGPLVAPSTAVIRAKAAGTLLGLKVGEGSRVKAGQVLGQIDLADLQSRAAERSASVESAQAALTEAERQHLANTSLASQNFISSTVLLSSQAKLDAARAQLKAMQAQLSTVNLGIREAALVAPISGIVGKRHALPGEKVSAEQQLLTVVDLSTLELAGTVGTHEVSRLQAGQPVQVTVEGSASPVIGHIDRIAPAAEAGTRAIGVVVVLDNKKELFRGGQYAQAAVTLNDEASRMSLPVASVGQASGQDFVWTLENKVLVRRIVITGRLDKLHGRVEVTKGLAPDAVVLAARFDNLKEGAAAKVVTQKLPPAALEGVAEGASAEVSPAASAPVKS